MLISTLLCLLILLNSQIATTFKKSGIYTNFYQIQICLLIKIIQYAIILMMSELASEGKKDTLGKDPE